MAINIRQLSQNIRQRLDDDKEKDIVVGGFQVESRSDSDKLNYSIQKALQKQQAKSPEPLGLVKSIVTNLPKTAATSLYEWGSKEAAVTKDYTFAQQFKRDWGRAAKTILWDLPRGVLGGLNAAVESVMEEFDVRVMGFDREETREFRSNPEQDKMIFGSESNSWQQTTQAMDSYIKESPIATDWEKQNLAPLVGVVGFVADAWVNPTKSGGKKLITETTERLVKETDEIAVKSILKSIDMPESLIEEVAPQIAKATKASEVDAIVQQSAKQIVRRAEKEMPEELAQRKLIDEATGRTPIPAELNALKDEAAKYADADEFEKAMREVYKKSTDGVELTQAEKQLLEQADNKFFDPVNSPIKDKGDNPLQAFFNAAKEEANDVQNLDNIRHIVNEADEPINLFRGANGKVDEVTKDFKNILEVNGDQKQLLKQLAANGDTAARKILDNPTDFYIKADKLIRTRFGAEFDAIKYNNAKIPQKGVEYHELASGKFFSTQRATAEVYAIQSRGAKYDDVATKQVIEDAAGDAVQKVDETVAKTVSKKTAKSDDLVTPSTNTGGEVGIKTPYKNLSPEQRVAMKEVNDSPSFKNPSGVKKTPEAVQEFNDQRNKLARMKDAILEQVQDDMIRVKRLVEDKRLTVSDASNPYEAEIAFHGRVGSRIEDVKQTTKAIDKDIIKSAKKAGVKDTQFTKEVNDYLIARHAPERNAALQDGAAGITTKAAKARVKEIESLPYAKEVTRIANKIQDLNNQTLDILKEGELITDDLYDLLREKYKHHIPLQRVMASEDDFAGALGKGFDVKGSGIKVAKGSDKEVADVMGNVVYNVEQAIIRAEKNRVDLSTLKLVRDNKEMLGDMFKVRKPRVIGESWSGKPITETITDPQILVMREKGVPTLIEIKDPQLAVALRGVNREKMGGMMRAVAVVSRTYSGIHTRFNPEFAFSNKIRDIQEVLVYTASKDEIGVRGSAKFLGKEARMQNTKAVLDHIRGKDSAGAKLYQQMRMDGGTTGGLGLSTRKQVELDIADIRKLNRSNPRKAAQSMLEYIDYWNTVFEDSSRLSVYRTALEGGATRQRAAIMAKESSVNFNKFGKQGQIINALYMFSNASIQGTVKTLRAMKNPKVAAAVTTSVFGSVYAISEWNDRVDPDWRNKVREWDRLNSLAVMLPAKEGDGEGVRYLTIPVAWGIKPIKVMADEFVDIQSGHSTGVTDAMSSILATSIEAYNPAGGSDLMSAVTPTILDIPMDIARNQAWHGGAIKPDWDKNAPASIQYFSSLRDSATGRTAIGLSKGLSGIGIEVSPASINYAYEQMIGGAGRFVNKTVNTITAAGGEDPIPTKEIPVVSRFYKTRPEEEVGQGASEFQEIAKILETQSRERFYLKQQAEDSLRQLNSLPKQDAALMFEELKNADPDLAAKVADLKKQEDKGLTFVERKILDLGVSNGERAKFLVKKFNELEKKEDKANLWNEYREKGIISDSVAKQLKKLLLEQ